MLVDDERDILTVLKKGLALKGYEVDAFSDSTKALIEFKPGRYDIVITDAKMPALNGFELYKAIRKQDDEVKMFILSGIDIYEHDPKLVFPNIDPRVFIHKPIGINDLIKTIEAN